MHELLLVLRYKFSLVSYWHNYRTFIIFNDSGGHFYYIVRPQFSLRVRSLIGKVHMDSK